MFLSIEGMEGSGKSTLAGLLCAGIEGKGMPVVSTREPGGCLLGKELRRILLNRASVLEDDAELFLFLADRAQHVGECLRPALAEGKWVVCDRYSDSTIAYQGYGRGKDRAMLRALCDAASGGLWPDKTLLLDLPEEEGLARARKRNGVNGADNAEGRFEAERMDFHRRVRRGFLELAAQEPERFIVLDATRPPREIFEEALFHLDIKI